MKKKLDIFAFIIILLVFVILITAVILNKPILLMLLVSLYAFSVLWEKKRDNKTVSTKKVNWALIPGETYCFRGPEGKWWNWEFVRISHNPKMPFIARYIDGTERNFNEVVKCGIVSPGSRDTPPSSAEIMTADNYEVFPTSPKNPGEI